EGMPLLHHSVAGTLGRDGQSVKLAREADREIADVDHLLHLAFAFGEDFSDFDRNEPAEIGFCRAEILAEQPDEFAASRARNSPPTRESGLRGVDSVLD